MADSIHFTNNICYWPATTIVRRIRTQEITVEGVVRAFLQQISQHNARINAITDLRTEADLLQEAREKDCQVRAGAVLGPLHGLPMTVKDGFSVRGLISSNGHPVYRRHRATEDAELVKRLKQAGAIIIGKTNLPLFSIDWQSTNWWFGQTNNPYDVRCVAGGSSGGAAAAVAMGFTPVELGSDAGGSIRVPAHFCGICGIRTTEQALSNRGQFKFPGQPQGHRLLTVAGPMAKNVADLLLLMPVLWEGGHLLAEIPPVAFGSSYWNGEKLAIAYAPTLAGTEVDAEYQQIFSAFLTRLAPAGHTLELGSPAYVEADASPLHGRLLGREIDASSPVPTFLKKAAMYLFILLKYRDKHWARGVWQGIGMSATRYATTLSQKEVLADSYTEFFGRFDIWLTPVASISAFAHQPAGKPFSVNGQRVPYTDAMGRFNFTTALAGHPIVVIPIGQTAAGLPVGVQIHAKKWTDKRLLEIAQHLETFTNGFQLPAQ
ncbi:amidase [Hymenobacter glaciei]|uniref:Amidase n=1 Tax=Hymenobacter glaciei TaxID=877209 RepID=A0ABP7UEU5_9BACT